MSVFFWQVFDFQLFQHIFWTVQHPSSFPASRGGVVTVGARRVIGGCARREGVRVHQWGGACAAAVKYRSWRRGASLLQESFTGDTETGDPQESRSYFSSSDSAFFSFKLGGTCDPLIASDLSLIASPSGRFSLPEAILSLENQNGAERGRLTTTLPHFCNHDVDEQQAAFQYAPHPARAQIHSSALQLGGHPQGLPAHTVGESKVFPQHDLQIHQRHGFTGN